MSYGGGAMRGVSFSRNFFLLLFPLWNYFAVADELALRKVAESVEEIKTLRVLIGRFDDSPNNKFVFQGQALQTADGSIRGLKNIECRREQTLAAALLNIEISGTQAQSLRWICRGRSYHNHQMPIIGSLSFSDRSGFFQIADRWYRGQLELRDTGKSLLAINHIGVEDYISSLLHGEIPHHYEYEALKAQAVAARSYAIAMALERRKANSPFDLLDDAKDQVYPGAQKETNKSNLAAIETKGQFLLFQGRILKSFYHAASGGYSELPSAVWVQKNENDFAAYLARPNIYDKGHYSWQLSLSPMMFETAFPIGKLIDLRVNHKTQGHRVQSLELIGSDRTQVVQIGNFRKLLSSIPLKSLKFDVKKEGSLWKFEGEGWGHGVGLSQVAAQNMAKLGKSYKEILRFHYPLAHLAEISNKKARSLEEKISDETLLIQVR